MGNDPTRKGKGSARIKRIMAINIASQMGGAELSLLEIVSNADRERYEFTVVMPPGGDLPCAMAKMARVVVLPVLNFSRARSFRKLLKLFCGFIPVSLRLARLALETHTDIIYANSTKAGVYGMVVKLFTGRKLIWHIRDNLESRFLAWLLGFYSDKIICNSYFTDGQLRSFASKRTVLHSFVSGKSLAGIDTLFDLRGELHLPARTMLLAVAGRLIPQKNHADAILAFSRLAGSVADVHLLIIGGDVSGEYPGYINYLKKLVKDHGLEYRVSFTGYQPRPLDYLAQINVLVNASIREPFGRTVLEATLLGKPVVAYNSGGPAEIVVNGLSGYLVDPKEGHMGLACGMERLIGDRDLLNRMSRFTKDYGRKAFDGRATMEKLEELFSVI